jgi:hypothetical protein
MAELKLSQERFISPKKEYLKARILILKIQKIREKKKKCYYQLEEMENICINTRI